MKKVLISLSMIAFVGVVAAGATGAFFSDTETSSGNTFAAGAIDLQIDNESYLNGVFNDDTSWKLGDLVGQLFFNFLDLKPGDWGEDTISIHVNNNPAWACIDVSLDSDNDKGLTEPEEEDGDDTDGPGEGELDEQVEFFWWADDGDNVLEDDEDVISGGTLSVLGVGATTTVVLADSNGSIFPEDMLSDDQETAGALLGGDKVYYVGKAFCFGSLGEAPLGQNSEGAESNRTPANSTGGISCDGTLLDNTAQSDSMTMSIVFRAVQARNNGDFSCQGD